jgi:hypothetical protein
MNRILILALLLAVIGGGLTFAPASHAQDYWNNYWGWYDNTYRPYYHRYTYRPYADYGYLQPSYGGYYDYGYAPRYYDYGGYRPYGGQVQVGPFSFGWR